MNILKESNTMSANDSPSKNSDPKQKLNSQQEPNRPKVSAKLEKLQTLVKRASIYAKFLADKLVKKPSDVPGAQSDQPDGDENTSRKKVRLDVDHAREQPKCLESCEMRDYQLVGLDWLISLYENGLNGILADEMGLGKTLQTIAFLAHLNEMGTHGPFLIVAPLSTLSNWKSEFTKFAPTLKTLLYHGNKTTRSKLRQKEMKAPYTGTQFPIIITSYEICMNDKQHLQYIPWKYIVVDEGHRLKNMDCKLVRDLKSYKSANRLLLTGTPLQNNLTELWSLLNFLMPEIFNDLEAFEEWFEFENDIDASDPSSSSSSSSSSGGKKMIKVLHEILTPFLLRRVKTDVVLDLPKKREYLLYAPMTCFQKELYDAVLRRELEEFLEKKFAIDYSTTSTPTEAPLVKSDRRRQLKSYLEKGEDDLVADVQIQSSTRPVESCDKKTSVFIKQLVGQQNLQMMIVQLRKVCNHPYLFQLQSDEADVSGGRPMVDGRPEILAWSGKMLLLDRLLTALLAKKHKVLVFSQMTSMLDIIQDYLYLERGLQVCRIDGGVRLEDRKEEIAKFNAQDDLSIFLLSTRAGGLGINLTAADTVIIFDSDWNPQVDLQAQDRVHRIGQTRPVIIYRLVTEHSVEKKILERARAKRTLEKVVIHKNKFKGRHHHSGEDEFDFEAILNEERLGANQIHAAQDLDCILSEEDLEKILDRSDTAYLSNSDDSFNPKFELA